MSEHSDDGTRQVETASYEGTAFECECGERFVHYNDLVQHIEDAHANAN